MLTVSVFSDEHAAEAFAMTKNAQAKGSYDAVELHEHMDSGNPGTSVQKYGNYNAGLWVVVWE